MKRKIQFILTAFLALSLFLPGYSFAFTPLGDAFVEQNDPSSNFGSNSNLLVGWVPVAGASGTYGQEHQSYIMFDITSLSGVAPANISSAILHLHAIGFPNYIYDGIYPGSVNAYHISDDTWAQNSINWNNKPSLASAPLMGISPTIDNLHPDFEINLLQYGSSWLAGDLSDGYLSVAVLFPLNTSSMVNYYFCSSENATCGPTLEITYTTNNVPEPATMLLLGLGVAGLAGARRFRG